MRIVSSPLWGSEARKGSGELASSEGRATSIDFFQAGQIAFACRGEEGGALRDLLDAQRIWVLFLALFFPMALLGVRGERVQQRACQPRHPKCGERGAAGQRFEDSVAHSFLLDNASAW